MSIGKRQLILATLVVALGAAVYLNWQFSGSEPFLPAGTTVSEKELGEAQLVNAPASSGAESSGSESSSSVAESTSKDYFAQARMTRQKARDEAVEMLEKVLDDAKSNDSAKKDAVAQAAVIAQNTLKESNIENLIKAKGFEDCVVFLQNDECSIVVKIKESSQSNAIVIKDIVNGQANISYDKIKIVESK